jgi:uroporphyrinogen III methyltransferase/synthase
VTGTLADLAQKAALAKVQPPAIILVGEAAGLDLRDLAHAPLTGVKIGLTGTLPFQDKLRALLAPLGAQMFSVQSAQCHPLPAEIPWGEIQANPCWLAFTSARGVEFFFQRVRQEEVDLRLFARCRFAVIGQETGRTLKSYGFTPDLCPEVFTSQALAEELANLLPAEETLWLFQAELGSDALAVKLGKQCRTIPLYGAEYGPVSPGPVPDYLLFGSGGGVRALAQTGYALDPHTTPVCIGPVAADACRTLFSRDPLVPPAATTQSMTDLLLAQAEK